MGEVDYQELNERGAPSGERAMSTSAVIAAPEPRVSRARAWLSPEGPVKRARSSVFLLLPVGILLAVFLLLPLLHTAEVSLTVDGGWSFAAYLSLFASWSFWKILFFTIAASAIV